MSCRQCCRPLAGRQAVPLRSGPIPRQLSDSGGWRHAPDLPVHPLLVVLAGHWGDDRLHPGHESGNPSLAGNLAR